MAVMNNDAFRIRTMRRNEIAIAVDWAAAEGWNPGLHDAECFTVADPQGFLIGENRRRARGNDLEREL